VWRLIREHDLKNAESTNPSVFWSRQVLSIALRLCPGATIAARQSRGSGLRLCADYVRFIHIISTNNVPIGADTGTDGPLAVAA